MSENASFNLVENGLSASSKGLYIIFFVGLAQAILDIQLTEFQLAIPWLMNVKMGNPDNIYILYTLILLFAVWKYYLSKSTELAELMAQSLSQFFNSFLGRKFIQKYILGPNEFSQSQCGYNENLNGWETFVYGYSDGPESCTESMGFLWLDAGTIRVHVGCDEVSGNSKFLAWNCYRADWGLESLSPWEQMGIQETVFKSGVSSIKNGRLKQAIIFFTSVYSMWLSLSTSKGLNVTLPILINLLLVNFILYSRIISMSLQ